MKAGLLLTVAAVLLAVLMAPVGGASGQSPDEVDPAAEILFHDDFETDLTGWQDDGTSDVCCEHSVRLVDDVARAGDRSARFEHRLGDPVVNNGNRAELSNTPVDLAPDGEYWFGYSIYLPPDYRFEPERRHWQTAFQIHARPDFERGENWRSPPFGLYIAADEWVVTIRASADPVNDNRSAEVTNYEIDLEIGEWTDWAVHVNFSHGDDGFARVYKNRELVVDHQGPTYYNDLTGPYVKTGVYRSPESVVPTEVLYVDELRIGTARAGLDAISPPADEPPPDDGSVGGVVRRGGAGVEGVVADVFVAAADGSRGRWLGDARSDGAGAYRFVVGPGCYVVTHIAPAGEEFVSGSRWLNSGVCVEAGERVDGIDATLAG